MNRETWLVYQHLYGCDFCGRARDIDDLDKRPWLEHDWRVYCPSCSVHAAVLAADRRAA